MSTRFELGLAGSPDTQPVSVTNPVPMVSGGVTTSTLNSTTAVLAGGAVFTGTAENISGYSDVRISVIASHASATDGLQFQQSTDGTNWDFVDAYTIPAATGKAFGFPVNATWGRIVYTNGGTLQTSFRLQTRYLPTHNKSSSVRPQDARSNENDMEENVAYDMVFNGTTWDRFVDPNLVARLVSAAASVNSTLVKSTPGRVHFVGGYNAAAALRYLKLYNKASAPTVGTDTPFYGPIVLPATAAFAIPIPRLFFTLGIGYGITVNGADADATALTAADITGLNIAYS